MAGLDSDVTAGACVRSAATTRPDEVIDLDAPFRLDLTAWALRRRAHNTIDRFDSGTYRRALAVPDGVAALSVTQCGSRDAPRLRVVWAGALAGRCPEVGPRPALDRLLGLTVDLSGFAAMAATDPLLDRRDCPTFCV
jgi:DNA-3-methyladenine glycosylase II